MFFIVSILALLLGSLMAAAASAKTTVKRTTAAGSTTLTITGDAGEEHDVTAEFDDDENLYMVTDDSTTLSAGAGCSYRSSEAMVVCQPGSPRVGLVLVTTAERDDSAILALDAGERSVISTGPGDDFIEGLEGRDEIDAGYGADVIDASDGNDLVQGGAGDDALNGGHGDDRLEGGSGDDSLHGEAGSDYLGGGPGVDTADYGNHKAGVTVDLDGNADDGQAGEHDNAAPDIENVKGGSGSDTLVGNSASNVLVGGDGNDTLVSRDQGPDAVSCGRGVDVAIVDAGDATDGLCETVDHDRVLAPSGFKIKLGACRGKTSNKTACVEVSCPKAKGACKGSMLLEATVTPASKKAGKRKASKIKLGSSNFQAASGRPSRVTVNLNRRAQKLLSAKGRLTALVKVDVRDDADRREGDTASVKLRGKKATKKPAGKD